MRSRIAKKKAGKWLSFRNDATFQDYRVYSSRKHVLDHTGNTSGVGPALASAFRTVDEKVLRAARQDGKDYGSTATVALCFAAHRALFVAHVGDSRSVLSRCPPQAGSSLEATSLFEAVQ